MQLWQSSCVVCCFCLESLRPTSEFVAVDKAGQQQHIYHSLRGQLSQGLLAEDDPGAEATCAPMCA